MSWQGIVGHDAVVEQLRSAVARGRMASSYLFVGPDGVGKRSLALALAQAMLCGRRPEGELSACGQCVSCQQAAAGTHPDILQVAKPSDKSELPIALLIGDKEHRLREGLCYEIGLKPMLGHRKFAIIDDADYLNEEGANSLLKTLEEPPPGSVLILISTSLQRQLPTIRSRCQVMRFAPLPAATIAELLIKSHATDDSKAALSAARRGDGGLTAALAAWDGGFDEARQPLLAALARQPMRIAEVEAALGNFGGEGKTKQAGRTQAQQALQLCADFYRQWLRDLVGGTGLEDAELRECSATAGRNCRLDAGQVVQCLERVLEAMRQVDRNAYAKLWPLSLASDLAAIYAGERITVGEFI